MASDYATIQVKSIELPFGKRRYEYEWIGESNKAHISDEALWNIEILRKEPMNNQIGHSFWLGDLQLVITDFNYSSMIYEVALADGQGYQRLYNRKLYYLLDNLKCRFILTLYVWGLAHIEPGERVTWAAIGRKK